MDNINNTYGFVPGNAKIPDRSKTFIPKGHYDQTKPSYNAPNVDNFSGYTKPYTAYGILEDDVTDLFKKIDNMPSSDLLVKRTNEKTLENTHDNTLTKKDQFGLDRSILPSKYVNAPKPDLLDMNVTGVTDHVVEHTIYINSCNRNMLQYPNPFNYRVDFNPVNYKPSTDTNNDSKDTRTNAYIGRVFKNVKYIDIKNITTPRRYYINKYNMTIINRTTASATSSLLNKFLNTNVNSSLDTPHKIYRGKITQTMGTVTMVYYFYYFEIKITTETYNIVRYDLFLDENFKQRVTINIDSGYTNLPVNKNIIDGFLASDTIATFTPIGSGTAAHTYARTLITQLGDTRYLVIINKNTTDKKIKFSQKNDVFEDIIDRVYEFTHDGTTSIINNTVIEYVLSDISLEDDRYLLLNIPELDSNYEYSTEQNANNNFSILFPDYINGDYFYLNTSYQDKIYNKGLLGKINKLTIFFRNSSNTDITISNANYIDYDITSPPDKCICTYDSATGEKIRNYTCSHSYLRHGGYEKLQNTIMIKVGVVEGTQQVLGLQ